MTTVYSRREPQRVTGVFVPGRTQPAHLCVEWDRKHGTAMPLLPFLRDHDAGTIVEVIVQPKAGRNELVGIYQGRLKVRLTAPPSDGEANRECLRFLAKALSIPRTDMEILRGHQSRQKAILIRKRSPQDVQNLLEQKGVE